MGKTETMKKVCIIVGSLRKDSFNIQLAKKVEELIPCFTLITKMFL